MDLDADAHQDHGDHSADDLSGPPMSIMPDMSAVPDMADMPDLADISDLTVPDDDEPEEQQIPVWRSIAPSMEEALPAIYPRLFFPMSTNGSMP